MNTFKDLIEDFSGKLHALIEGEAVARARAAVMHAFGAAPAKRGPGRPPKALAAVTPAEAEKTSTKRRKKAPLQLCPVPGCKNPAAPVFGMVCSKHKDLPKRLIKKYREARKAKKLGVKAVGKTAKRATKKRAKSVIKKAPKAGTKKARKVSPKKVPKAPATVAPTSGSSPSSSEAA